MRRSFLSLLLLAGFMAGAVAVLFLIFWGSGATESLEAVPASARAALLISSVPDLLEDISRTRMGPAAGESGWDLLANIIRELLEARGIPFDPDPSWLSRSLRGGATLAWVPSEQASAPAHLVLAFDLPGRPQDPLGLFERTILPDLRGAGATWRRRTHRGHEYGTLRFPGAAEMACVTVHERLAVITVSGEAMRQSLEALYGRDPSLVSDVPFRHVRGELREQSNLVAYGSASFIQSLLSAGEPRAGPGMRALGRLLSLGPLEGAGISITVDRAGLFHEKLRVFAPRASSSILGELFGGRPRPIAAAALLPEPSPLRLGLSVGDPGAVWEHLPEIAGAYLGQEPSHVRERLKGFEEFLGPNVRRDLFGTLGTEIALALDTERPGRSVLALSPSDAGAAHRLLARLDGLAHAADAYHSERLPNAEIVTYDVTRLDPWKPSYAFRRDDLVLSGSTEALRLALAGPADRAPGRPPAAAGAAAILQEGQCHLCAVAETEHLLDWIRRLAEGDQDRRGSAWLGRLRDLLPGSTGPLPDSTASFRMSRDGVSGEWSGPLSPLILTTLILASPQEPAGAAPPLAEPEPSEPEASSGPPASSSPPPAPGADLPAADPNTP
jgi:hypothetical protein